MVAILNSGVHFKEPWLFMPMRCTNAGNGTIRVYDSGDTLRLTDTTEFFTEMARRGLQDQTNWTADTFKTILSVSGKGLVAAYIGCVAGGAETHTVEFTVDGAVTTIVVDGLASGERAALHTGALVGTTFSTAQDFAESGTEALASDKATFSLGINAGILPPWRHLTAFGTPLLRFNRSLLIRAKHSASITNSTSTAYSALQYRLGL